MRRSIIMGAGGRDFHNFNVVFRDDPDTEVVAFTATQIPGIAERIYPAVAGRAAVSEGDPDPPRGRATRARSATHGVDEVVLAYSDLEHEDVMHKASMVLAAGADFTLLGPGRDDARREEAGRRGLRGADRLRQEPDQPEGRADRCSTRA